MSDTQSNSVGFVRKDFLEPSPPPAREAGAVKWLRENLFSGPVNTILTLLSIYFLFVLIQGVYPWFANGVWNTSSLSECRQILEGANAACFSVLQDRGNQMLFGIAYPADQYWRPILAFVLLFVCAVPVLFSQYVPRQTFIATALYPFFAYWLIWGGTLWLSIMVLAFIIGAYFLSKVIGSLPDAARSMLGIVVGGLTGLLLAYWLAIGGLNLWGLAGGFAEGGSVGGMIGAILFYVMAAFVAVTFIPMGIFTAYAVWQSHERGFLLTIVTTLAFLILCLTFLAGPISEALSTIVPLLRLEAVASRDLGGFMLNMILGTVCVSLSIPLGILLALGRQSSLPFIKGVSVIFIEFIRGVPLITLLFVANVVLAYFFPPESNIDLVLRVIIMITMFASAYIAEVIRGGLAALPRGQYEAGDSLGLDYAQSMRLIILPQALKISIPGIVNVAVGLFKDTTLVSVISMFDLVGAIRGPIASSTDWTGIYWEVFGFAAVLFFIVCYGISQYSQWLERQLATDHR
ncbi:MAG: amino acid ABC transporter permease [Pseudomonadota bacterium]